MYALPEVIRHLDELTRADLQNLRDSYFFWLLISSGVVALGVVLEGPEIVHETVGIIRRFSGAERKTPSWITWLALVGWLFVVFGLAGEGIAEALVSQADGLIQTFNDILLTDAQLEITRAEERAGEAKASAINAAEASDRANTSAQNAKKEAAIAKTRAEDVGKQADEVRGKTVELAAKLAVAESAELEERKKVVELEKSFAPRMLRIQIGGGMKDSFFKLKPFAGTQVIFEVLPDPEAQRAAASIGDVLGMAGWNITGMVQNPKLYTQEFDGVTIEFNAPAIHPTFSLEEKNKRDLEERCGEAARALEAYLMFNNWIAWQFPVDEHLKHNIPPNTIKIIVGFKPNPFIEHDWAKRIDEQNRRLRLQERDREKELPHSLQSPQK
jgi:hypothetical protein